VVAKVRREWLDHAGATAVGGRPRLAHDLATGAEQTRLEYAGLQQIHRIFGADDAADGRFGAVRPLAHMAAMRTLLLEYVEGRTLRDHLVGYGRVGGRSWRRCPEEVWRHAGAWLARFQDGTPSPGLPSRQSTREAVAERFDAYTEFLARRLSRRAVGDVVREAAQRAADVLPDRPTLAVGHGDYAPRNVIVRTDGRLAVLDPMPRWQVPRYEDLARFLVAVRVSGSQVHTGGMAYSSHTLDRLEELVTEGYRVEAGGLDPAELRCMQLLVLLDRWSALVASGAAAWPKRMRAAPARLVSIQLRREALRLADAV
jgi:aminoglycoside phosphotransferase (APT) family kinase protein